MRWPIWASCALLALATTARAQDAAPIVYDVELVVFQNLGTGAAPEDWNLEAQLAARDAPVVGIVRIKGHFVAAEWCAGPCVEMRGENPGAARPDRAHAVSVCSRLSG